MERDGNFAFSVELVGSRQVKPPDQMDQVCSRLDATWRRLADDNFSPLFGFAKDLSTTTQANRILPRSSHHSMIWVLPCLSVMHSSVVVTWGVITQCSRPDSHILWPPRTLPGFFLCMSSAPSLFSLLHPLWATSLYVFQLGSSWVKLHPFALLGPLYPRPLWDLGALPFATFRAATLIAPWITCMILSRRQGTRPLWIILQGKDNRIQRRIVLGAKGWEFT